MGSHFWLAHARKHTFAGYIALSDLPLIFKLVIAPNLVFELFVWTGFAIIVRELNSVIVVIQMGCYVVPRIYKLKEWYYSHPEDKMDSVGLDHNKDRVSMHTSFQSTQIVM